MTDKAIQGLFVLLRVVLHPERRLTPEEKEQICPEYPAIYELAKKHALAHLIGYAARTADLLPEGELTDTMKRDQIAAVYRYESIRHELEQLCRVLEQAEIPFAPLKGSVLRQYYPEPWMRTSCDIDVLLHESDLSRAIAHLQETLQYTGGTFKSSYDVVMYTRRRLHIELHFRLSEKGKVISAEKTLDGVWDHMQPVKEGACHHVMTDAIFYLHHIAHMAKHFENGGCGVRPFLDLWILDHRVSHNRQQRDALLQESGLLTFAEACRRLAESWFSGAPLDAVSRQMQGYILYGGVYGSQDNLVAVQQGKQGGKVRYALRRIFLPYDDLKYHYPILQKHPWLTPVGHVCRWGKLLFCGQMKRAVRELRRNEKMENEMVDSVARLLKEIGL